MRAHRYVFGALALVGIFACGAIACGAFSGSEGNQTLNVDGGNPSGGGDAAATTDGANVGADAGVATGDAACGDVTADENNCGTCGLSCMIGMLSGQCKAGICQPIKAHAAVQPVLVRANGGVYWTDLQGASGPGVYGHDDMGSTSVTLVVDGGVPTALALNGTYVGFVSLRPGGTGAAVVTRPMSASLPTVQTVPNASGIGVSGATEFYVGSGDGLSICSEMTPCLFGNITTTTAVSLVAGDTSSLAFVDAKAINLLVSDGGYASAQLSQTITDLAVAGSYVYAATGNGLAIFSKTRGSIAVPLSATGVAMTGVAVSATKVYFAGSNGSGDGVIGRTDLDGSNETSLGYGPVTSGGIAVDGDYLYFVDQNPATAGIYEARLPP